MTAAAAQPDDDLAAHPDAAPLERLAHAHGLLMLARMLHSERRAHHDAAVDALAKALDRAVDARDAYTAAGDTLIEAARTAGRL